MVSSKPRVLIIIPAYNEAENIVDTVQGVVDAGYDYVVVNDGSKDNTLSVCFHCMRAFSQVVLSGSTPACPMRRRLLAGPSLLKRIILCDYPQATSAFA